MLQRVDKSCLSANKKKAPSYTLIVKIIIDIMKLSRESSHMFALGPADTMFVAGDCPRDDGLGTRKREI